MGYYVYAAANRLKSVSEQLYMSSYQFDGLGDRLQQTVAKMGRAAEAQAAVAPACPDGQSRECAT